MNPHVRLRHIRCFLEIARAGSLSLAAEGLGVSQPAASRTLRELEEILGARLFDRAGRGLRLNEAGRAYQAHAGRALTELTRAEQAVARLDRAQSRLTVGILPSAASELFPRAALAFAAGWPDCTLRVSTGPNWLLLSQLRDGSLDVVLGRMADPQQMSGLTFEELYIEDIVAAARPGHPLTGRPPAPADLAGFPLILPPKGAVIAGTVRGFLTSAGLQDRVPLFETVSLAFARRVLERSEAIWFISRGVIADELARGQLVTLDLTHRLLAGPVGITLREDGAARPELAALLEAVRAARG